MLVIQLLIGLFVSCQYCDTTQVYMDMRCPVTMQTYGIIRYVGTFGSANMASSAGLRASDVEPAAGDALLLWTACPLPKCRKKSSGSFPCALQQHQHSDIHLEDFSRCPCMPFCQKCCNRREMGKANNVLEYSDCGPNVLRHRSMATNETN